MQKKINCIAFFVIEIAYVISSKLSCLSKQGHSVVGGYQVLTLIWWEVLPVEGKLW